MIIPSFESAIEAVEEDFATPLDIFVYNNEPAGPEEIQFRKELQDLVDWAFAAGKAAK